MYVLTVSSMVTAKICCGCCVANVLSVDNSDGASGETLIADWNAMTGWHQL